MSMFEGLQTFHPQTQSEADLAANALADETTHRFSSWSANDAVTLGLSIRKRFRSTVRHAHQGKGAVLSVETIQGHTLFSCTIGDLGGSTGAADVSLDAWTTLSGMMAVVRRTGHCSFYVEKGMAALGKTPQQLGIQGEFRALGGAFPIWLQNALCCPIAVVGLYSGSSLEDHKIISAAVRDYIKKMNAPGSPEGSYQRLSPAIALPNHMREQSSRHDRHPSNDHLDSVHSSPVAPASPLRGAESTRAESVRGESLLRAESTRGGESALRGSTRGGDSVLWGPSPSTMLRAESTMRGGDSMYRAESTMRGGDSVYRAESTVRGGESMYRESSRGGGGGESVLRDADSFYRESSRGGGGGESVGRGGNSMYRESTRGGGESTIRGGESTYRESSRGGGESTVRGETNRDRDTIRDQSTVASWNPDDGADTAFTYGDPVEY